MKATALLCPVITLLCASRFVCTAQRGYHEYNAIDSPSSMIQDDYLLEKRTKPSLSIVNPLDVLRQRLLLEIARRQMKENTRQVEINRAILKNVGKRGPDQHHPVADANSILYELLHSGDNIEDENSKKIQTMNHEYATNEIGEDDDNDYRLRYLYRLHKNRYNRK
ncbi:diuretic hormone 44 [Episyrphus balteatus]|uniref:diuretic hormone 44 n=1 Tax=Episyrphus balteatus TaxID=286459 RepID=UPI002485B3DC|nr:diuretic hormone 44 [Episyrphus balteatus]XP_055857375.1 diuretic hormone 44 [Episyrphus balteatus]